MGTNRWINNYVKEFPIIRATDEKQNSIVKLVDQILISNEMNALNDTSAQEAEVDRLVYKLYELTKGEIAIVEETVRQR
jgi:hypothetical protein